MLYEFKFVLIFLIISFLISCGFFFLSSILATREVYIEKNSAYECGFNPFEDARNKFDIRFYLVGILFIIFDLEVVFLFPWSLVLSQIGETGFWSMIIFLIILLIGFIYEWKKNALEWS